MSLQNLQSSTHTFDPTSSNEDFLEQILCGLQTGVSWPELSTGTAGSGGGGVGVDLFDDQSAFLTTKLQQHQISAGDGGPGNQDAKSLVLQQQFLRDFAGAGDSPFFQNEMVDTLSFKSPNGSNSIQQALFNGFTGSLQSNQTQNFQYPPAQRFRAPNPATAPLNEGPTTVGPTAAGSGGPPAQPRQRVRARRGQATDPHSIAERLRRERIAERMKSLQELVPTANKTDKALMLDEIIDYVKFLQVQVKVLSMSRMGGVAAVAPLVAEGANEGAGGGAGRSSNGTPPSSSSTNDTMTVAENQVVKLMEQDMGSAMQYLQGKGLCLMPISLATAISTATTTRHLSPPNLSVLSVQSANGVLPLEVVSVQDSTAVLNS